MNEKNPVEREWGDVLFIYVHKWKRRGVVSSTHTHTHTHTHIYIYRERERKREIVG